MRIGRIIRGWGMKLGLITTSSAEKKLSDLRLQQCKRCPLSEESKVLKILAGGQADYEQEIYCTKCGCPCEAKTLVVDEECPVKKW